jgi:hypothetical protein
MMPVNPTHLCRDKPNAREPRGLKGVSVSSHYGSMRRASQAGREYLSRQGHMRESSKARMRPKQSLEPLVPKLFRESPLLGTQTYRGMTVCMADKHG